MINEQYNHIKLALVSLKLESKEVGLNEIFVIDNKAKVTTWLDKDIVIISLSKEYKFLVEEMKKKPPIFVLHISPISKTIDMFQDNKLETIFEEQDDLWSKLNNELSFSVQVRIIGQTLENATLNKIETYISNKLILSGFLLDVKNPCQVISVNIKENICYIGLSFAKDNISNWTAGKHRFSKEKEQISRAEFKLLEAIDYFGIELKANIKALDIGAAPGGWTRVLVNKGCVVTSVDPAQLDKALETNNRVSYFKGTIQDFLKLNSQNQYDIIVNDMKMDAKESANIMCIASGLMKNSGIGIITLKLPHKFNMRKVKDAFKIMEKHYEICGARQLFHNRSELTVYVLKKH